jgi:hypothetical protein
MTDRDRILERLKRLLAMTTENGASEAEAMIAAHKAAILMAAHDMTFASVEEIEAQSYADDTRPWFKGGSQSRHGRFQRPPVWRCLPYIEKICGCRHWYSPWNGTLSFFGPAHATATAHYLVTIISRAMEREWDAYAKTLRPGMRTRHRGSFFAGISTRIAHRLNAMHDDEQRRHDAGTGRDLVLVRNALVERRFAESHDKVEEKGGSLRGSNPLAEYAGWQAGDNVDLNRGVTEAAGAKLIGSGGAP